MQAYIDYLQSDFEDVNTIFIDCMDLDSEEIKEEVHNRSGSDSVSFIEVQFYIETFRSVYKELHADRETGC